MSGKWRYFRKPTIKQYCGDECRCQRGVGKELFPDLPLTRSDARIRGEK